MKVPGRALFALLAAVLFTAEPGFSQYDERRGFIGLGIGPSAPLGSFGDASSIGTRSGRATSGYTDTFLNLGYRFRPNFGVAGAFAYSEYPVLADDDDWWQVAAIMVGPMYSLRLNARAAVDLKAMVGMIALTPIVDGFTTDDQTGAGLGLDLRVAIRYDVLRRWALFAEGGLQSSNVAFSADTRTSYRALISGFGVAYRPTW